MADVRRLPGPNTDLWDWQLEGACRGLDSSLFFHPDNERGPSRARRENEAKTICASCPVVDPCRAHALEVREPYGVWGGLSEAERNQLLGTGRGDALLAPDEPVVVARAI
jgi:WhiB family redox-sensing transcriptional regulator